MNVKSNANHTISSIKRTLKPMEYIFLCNLGQMTIIDYWRNVNKYR